MSWTEAVCCALKAEPHPNKIFWFHDLTRFAGWQVFVHDMVKREGAIYFSHKGNKSVAHRYAGQRVVIFSLAGAPAAGESLECVFENMRKLKSGVLFCTKTGVKTFRTPHVVVFADFPVPHGSKALSTLGEERKEAPQEVREKPLNEALATPVKANNEAEQEALVEAWKVEDILL